MTVSLSRTPPPTHRARRTETAVATKRHIRHADLRLWGRWLAAFVGFPLAGLAAEAAAGRIDATDAAIIGGLAAGVVLGVVQSLSLRRPWPQRAEWAVATAIGLAFGLTIGATSVDFATDTTSLVAMGLASGAGVGVAQALVLRSRWPHQAVWAVATTGLWGLGWLITSNVISDTDSQYATFGASGALVATALGGILLAAGADGHAHANSGSIPASTSSSNSPRSPSPETKRSTP